MTTNSSANIPTGASNTVLQGQGVGTANAFSTATYPATTTAKQLLYSSAANTIGGLSTANSSVLVTDSSGNPSLSTTLPSGLTIPGTLTLNVGGGPSLNLVGTGTNPTKYVYVNNTGGIAINNSADSAVIFTLSDAGVITQSTWNGATVTVPYGGTGVASTTAYMPICGGTTTTGALQSVATGTVGYALTYTGASSLPTWQPAGGGGGSGIVVQEIRATTTTAGSTTNTLAITGTTPTTSNTDSLITATVTALSSSNILKFNLYVPGVGGSQTGTFALFKGNTFVTASPFNFPANGGNSTFSYYMTAPDTSAHVWTMRIATTTGTIYWLQNSGSTAFYNATGNSAITFTVTEVTP